MGMARAQNKLTDTAIRAATFEKLGSRTKLTDGAGMYLDVQPSGRYWRLKYRVAGKERLMSLGVYPEISLKQARTARDEARSLLAEGIDPVQHRKARQQEQTRNNSNTFYAVAVEWFDQVHSKTVGPTTAPKNKRRLEMYAFPLLAKRPLSDITAPEVLEVLRRIERKGHIDNAHRLKTLISQVMRYGVSTGKTSRDVTSDLKGILPPVPTKHFAALVTPETVTPLLLAIDNYVGSPTVSTALKLAPMLFLRPGSLRHMRWEEIDWERGEWTTQSTKNGDPLLVPLPEQALILLQELEALTGRSEWVFPSHHGRGRPMSENALTAALNRMGFKGIMTSHGFRAMAKTILTERLGFRTEIIEMQMAHRVRDVHGRAYNRTTWLPERRAMMQQWADYLDGLRNGENVVAGKFGRVTA
jgi:integrase